MTNRHSWLAYRGTIDVTEKRIEVPCVYIKIYFKLRVLAPIDLKQQVLQIVAHGWTGDENNLKY